MEIIIQSIHFDADTKLVEHVESKVRNLEKFFDNIIDAYVYMKFDNESSVVKDKIVEIKLNLPNAQLFSKEVSKTFEESADMAVESMRRQLEKLKGKVRS